MSTRTLSLRRLSISSSAWYLGVLIGVPVIAWALWRTAMTAPLDLAPSFVTIAALIAVLELLPLVQGRGHDPQGVVMSTSFAFAMMFIWGVWPTVVLVCLSSVLADTRRGKALWKIVFNPSQYAVSLLAAWLVVRAAGQHPTLDVPLAHFHATDVWWMACAWIAYHVVNVVIVSAAISFDSGLRETLFADAVNEAMVTFAVLALSPLIVILALGPWPVIPLLLIPLLMIYYTAQIALDREHQAGHDALTGLPNRSTLTFTVEQALSAHRRGGPSFSLMLLDLDDFKNVNDALGHHAGDKLLTDFAERITASLRPNDIVARLGGDEMALVAFDVDAFQSCVIAQRMRDHMATPFEIEGVTLEVGFSVGIAVCPQHGEDAATLLRHADIAMFHAKGTRSGVELYSPDQDTNSASRLGLTGELRVALESNALSLHYQPKVGTAGRPIGLEALVRWHQPSRGWVAPDEFIPLAERSGLMPRLTSHVLDVALAQIAEWCAEGIGVPVAVNISPSDLVAPRFADTIADKLAQHHVPATMLTLEITERVLSDQPAKSRATLDRLREMGVAVSLDDFGTGYSSLMRLSSMPVDEIKIDRAFVAALDRDRQAFGVINALIGLAHSLGVPAVAEGVETEYQHHLLRSMAVDGLQGWHVARPMPGDEATEWLRTHTATPARRSEDITTPAVERPALRLLPADDDTTEIPMTESVSTGRSSGR